MYSSSTLFAGPYHCGDKAVPRLNGQDEAALGSHRNPSSAFPHRAPRPAPTMSSQNLRPYPFVCGWSKGMVREDTYSLRWTEEDREAECEMLNKGLIDRRRLKDWRYWFRKELWCEQ